MELADRYVYKVYVEKSFSVAAKKLYISQSSLSLTVKKLESRLGFDIFDRSTSPIGITREGRVYIEYLEECVESENNMHSRIKSFSRATKGQIAVGSAFSASRHLLPSVCKEFQDEHPEVELRLYMGETDVYSSIIQKLDSGALNIAIGYHFDQDKYSGIPIVTERYVVALRKDYPCSDELRRYAISREELLSDNDLTERIISDYSLFKGVDFIRVNSKSTLWRDMSRFLSHCDISRCQIYNSRNIDIIYDMMLCGMGAAITTDIIVAQYPPHDDVMYFLVKVQNPTCQLYAIYKKGAELSDATKSFINKLKNIADINSMY